ncbi:MAG: MlaE family ABC transporter permease [Burkholderiaceae bacterium]
MADQADQENYCSLGAGAQSGTLYLHGDWRLAAMPALASAISAIGAIGALPASSAIKQLTQIDGSQLRSVDTASALLLWRRLQSAGVSLTEINLTGLQPNHRRILAGVLGQLPLTDTAEPKRPPGLLAALGKKTVAAGHRIRSHVAYLGLACEAIGQAITHPGRLRGRELFTQLQQTGLSAIPVISLVMFLIGAVMAYLLGLQAEQYGANIYVVDGVALGTVREFAPLLVATVVAGRSGASFTAQLGTMKLTEEIDAIRTLGLSAEQVLLLPRVVALVIVLPLLVFVGSVMALIGAAVVCDLMLGITADTFFERMRSALSIRHYLIGLLKAPVFAVVIAVIGCSMGLSANRDTRSIGLNTTSTVVQCIVAVVLLDALFAIVFQTIGW